TGKVEHQVQIDVDEPRHVLGSLDIAAHPVNRIGDTAQHCCCPRSTEIITSTSGSSVLTCGSPASTQVSLLPPPCDALTTSDPFFNATRVRPPGSTKMSLP